MRRRFIVSSLLLVALKTFASGVLPEPTGRYAVGVRLLTVSDESRREVVEPDVGGPRALALTIWYPSKNAPKQTAVYTSVAASEVLSARFGLEKGFEKQIVSHAYANAPLAAGRFSVVLLDHGLGMMPELYTGLGTELASHGFVVIAINHTFTSALSELPRGARTYTPPWPRNVERSVQGARMGEYVATWVADDRYVLDQLPKIANTFGWGVRVDASRVVAIGHSYGGTVAGVIGGVDDRIVGAINLDGSIYPGMPNPVESRASLLILTTPATTSVQEEFRSTSGRTFGGAVRDSTHMTYTDVPLLQAAFGGKRNLKDELLRAAAVRLVVLEFVDFALFARPAPTLESVLTVTSK